MASAGSAGARRRRRGSRDRRTGARCPRDRPSTAWRVGEERRALEAGSPARGSRPGLKVVVLHQALCGARRGRRRSPWRRPAPPALRSRGGRPCAPRARGGGCAPAREAPRLRRSPALRAPPPRRAAPAPPDAETLVLRRVVPALPADTVAGARRPAHAVEIAQAPRPALHVRLEQVHATRRSVRGEPPPRPRAVR